MDTIARDCVLWIYIYCKYLIEKGCNLAAVNNDGELALDITESDEMEDMYSSI